MEAPALPSAPAQSHTMDFMFDTAPDPLTQCDGIMAGIDRGFVMGASVGVTFDVHCEDSCGAVGARDLFKAGMSLGDHL